MTTAHKQGERRNDGGGQSQSGAIRILMDRLGELEGSHEQMAQRLAELEDRVSLVEARDRSRTPNGRSLDDTAVAMIRFMETHYPMKFTALTLGENLELDNEKLGGRLNTLLVRGLIASHKREGRTTMWSALPPEARPGGSSVTGDE